MEQIVEADLYNWWKHCSNQFDCLGYEELNLCGNQPFL